MFLSPIVRRTIMKIQDYSGGKSSLASLCLPMSIIALSVLLILSASSAWSATISGNVEIEGRKDMSGVLITAQEAGLSGVTSRNGTYSINDVP